ncbi:MAG: carboxypeptidase-like regulatory domain-containing protein [Chitinophagaceae bacterium]
MKRILLTCLLFSVTYLAMAQKTVSGKIVSGENKQPLSGATITNKKTKLKTVSDIQGSFSILASDNDILEITNVGYADKEVKAGSAPAQIELQIAATNLNEVVVTAGKIA